MSLLRPAINSRVTHKGRTGYSRNNLQLPMSHVLFIVPQR